MSTTSSRMPELRRRVEAIIGPLYEWEVSTASVQFRAERPITLKDIVALSAELGTEAINFDFGESGDPGYSEMTPSSPGSPGFVEVMFPIAGCGG